MDTDTIKKISQDIAVVQHNSDILTQWPIPSIEAMYYAGPFFVPSMLKEIGSWPNTAEELFAKKLLPGKLSNMLFFFLNDQAKKKMGAEAHAFAVASLIKNIKKIRINGESATSINETWLPQSWEALENTQGQNLKKLAFLLDNLNEMSNPLFRALGTQYFFKGENVYRYYYDTGLEHNILLIAKKKSMQIDYFEHVHEPEDLADASVFIITGEEITKANTEEIEADVQEKITSLENSTFDRAYVLENLFSSFGYTMPDECKGFIKTPFPKEITDFYVKTCTLPVEILSKEIYNVLGGEQQ